MVVRAVLIEMFEQFVYTGMVIIVLVQVTVTEAVLLIVLVMYRKLL